MSYTTTIITNFRVFTAVIKLRIDLRSTLSVVLVILLEVSDYRRILKYISVFDI